MYIKSVVLSGQSVHDEFHVSGFYFVYENQN